MNSMQINFFLTANDQAALLDSFRKEGQFVVVHPRAHDGKIHALGDAEIKEMGRDLLKVYLVQPKDVDLIQLNDLKSQTYKSLSGKITLDCIAF